MCLCRGVCRVCELACVRLCVCVCGGGPELDGIRNRVSKGEIKSVFSGASSLMFAGSQVKAWLGHGEKCTIAGDPYLRYRHLYLTSESSALPTQ